MDRVTIGLIGILVMVFLLALGMPIGAVMALVGFAGAVYLVGLSAALGAIGMIPYDDMLSYTLSAVPMFVLMGAIVSESGIARLLYAAAHKWMGHLRGGVGIATVAACGAFASICGSSLASAATMGTIALPEMNRYDYKKSFAAGIVAAGGTVGILIPPSIIFVLYGVMTEQSVGKLFMAGFVPGVIEVILYAATVAFLVKLRPDYAPKTPARAPFKEMVGSLPSMWPTLILFLLVLGGIYTGFATPTEAGAVGAFGALVIAIASRWFSRKKMVAALSDTLRTTGLIFFIVSGAMIYSYFLAVSNLPFALAEFAVRSPLSPHGVLVLILVMYLILGCVLDSLAMMLLTVPIFAPVLFSLGFDPIWFGVIIVMVIEIGLITPPVGMNVYVLSGVAKDVPMSQIFAGIWPFFFADLVLVGILIAFPQIALFLPNLMG